MKRKTNKNMHGVAIFFWLLGWIMSLYLFIKLKEITMKITQICWFIYEYIANITFPYDTLYSNVDHPEKS